MLDESEKKVLCILRFSVCKATQTRHSMRRNGGCGFYALRIDWMLGQIASCIYVGDATGIEINGWESWHFQKRND